MANMKQKIRPFLWFDKECEEAIKFYVETFSKNPAAAGSSKIVSIQRYPEGQQVGPMKGIEGKVLTAIFELEGQRFMALDGARCSNSTNRYHSMSSVKHRKKWIISGRCFQQFRKQNDAAG